MADPSYTTELIAVLPSLRSYAFALTRSEHRADDLVQDTLERAWRSHDKYLPGMSLKAWLCAIMRNRHIDGLRHEKWTVEDVDGKIAATLATAPAQSWHLQYADFLNEVGRLKPGWQDAIQLCWFGGLSHGEAAKALSLPLGTLKARVRRAKEKLRTALKLEDMSAAPWD